MGLIIFLFQYDTTPDHPVKGTFFISCHSWAFAYYTTSYPLLRPVLPFLLKLSIVARADQVCCDRTEKTGTACHFITVNFRFPICLG